MFWFHVAEVYLRALLYQLLNSCGHIIVYNGVLMRPNCEHVAGYIGCENAISRAAHCVGQP